MQMKWMERVEESFTMGTFGVGSNAEITKKWGRTQLLPCCLDLLSALDLQSIIARYLSLLVQTITCIV